ncbi:MAG: hypothetical protein QCI38_06435, partial [Candidatus Thermoplasmatota archaeon]|nr:hypothetical protein [Candidatus Thermoplasmatota archaeon]
MKTVHFSKRVHYFILLFLVVLVVILHYPLAPRELGADSYYIHSLGDSITRNGYSTWTFHALSYIGLYPESYPAAVPFLISAASQLSGLPMEETIYFVSLIFAFMGLFAAYMVAGAIWGDDRFKFIVAFAFSTSPIIIKFTNWTMSTRGLLLVLMPLILWLMIKSSKSEGMDKLAFIFSSILLLFLMALVHRMFWFVLAFLIIFYAIHFVYRLTLKRGAYRRYTAKGQHLITLSLLGMNALAMFMALLVFTFTDLPVLGGILPQSLSGGVAVFKEAIFILLLAGVFASVLLWVLAGERKKLKLMASLCITVTGITLFFIQFTQLAIWSDT